MGNSPFQRQISSGFVPVSVRGVFNVIVGSVHSSGRVYAFPFHSQSNDDYILVDCNMITN